MQCKAYHISNFHRFLFSLSVYAQKRCFSPFVPGMQRIMKCYKFDAILWQLTGPLSSLLPPPPPQVTTLGYATAHRYNRMGLV